VYFLRNVPLELEALAELDSADRAWISALEPRSVLILPLLARGELLGELAHGLVFANLVDTDQVYGHRKDIAGFHGALQAIDAAVAGWLERLGEDDLLVLTADHGCDPTAPGTDHTREHAPLLASFPGHGGRRHDGPLADVGASALRWLTGEEEPGLPGSAFVP